MVQIYLWLVIAVSLLLAGFGASLNRRNHPSGLLMVMAGLLGAFFSLGFVVGDLI